MNIALRRKTRDFLLQAMYQMLIRETTLDEILDFFSESVEKKADVDLFHTILSGVFAQRLSIEECLQKHSSREIDQLDIITRAILYMFIYEMLFMPHPLDKAVAIDEAIRLSKTYGSDKSYQFINGVLDKISHV